MHGSGAQLAGSLQHAIAAHFIDRLDKQPTAAAQNFRGVVFYVTKTSGCPPGVEVEGWYVMDRQKRIVLKSRSPIHEADSFVLFDEARCR